ncbi:family 43 glycosylhydrolase [Spirosoma montaniterrae]|uniref:Coagulation factor 5/8 type domain protein n=1 Tax=Spirosoma montaniterrae TaxID=1178516 RepID=A0A1P9WS26_9BACT|nr:family 43 glycosylhydrolase [Spirosoma montaniterrae]AQG78186.1 coagulation factor 5/8 type domain protein [Spirosoma montaniterrae]
MNTLRLLLALCLLSAFATAQTPKQPNAADRSPARTYCNPMDISYRYNFEQMNERVSYRSGADPVIINHKGEYYLFVTIQGGWWHSKDLSNWRYVVPDKWPMEDMCAPAALSVRDTLYLFQSTFEQRPIFISTEPEKGKLKFYNRWLPRLPKDIGPWDPALFHDPDTDKWYMYWGSSNVYPIFGAELDKSRKLTYAGNNPAEAYKAMFWLDPYKHGWERFGPNHSDPFKPFTEGAWMTKYNGKYYLQYGAPGTEYNVYGNGTYVGKDPLGPFEYAPYNPIAYKPGGFATGCGHGNTFQDNYGNYWNTGTTWIGVNWGMERRIVMNPAGFDKDDQMHVNTRFGDYPHYLPTGKWTNRDELFTGWMLLNYRKPVTASSTLATAPTDTVTADRVADENPRTFWVAGQNKSGETLTTDLGAEADIRAVQVDYFDYKLDIFDSDSTVYTQFKILTSLDGKRWETVADLTKEPKKDHACAYVEISVRADGKPVRARYVRYEHVYTAGKHLSINAFRVFGTGTGKAPATPPGLTVKRQKDQRNADISWGKVPGATGYNIRWGIAPDKLYQTYQFFHDQAGPRSAHHDTASPFELRALNVGVPYYFAIEAFNENGVSALSEVVSGE